jgi:hypothetical protein
MLGKIKLEANELRFEFVTDPISNSIKIVTYNNRGKDAEWIRTK